MTGEDPVNNPVFLVPVAVPSAFKGFSAGFIQP